MNEPEVWTCKIGGRGTEPPAGADFHMRRAIEIAYLELTGKWPDFIFSGWGGSLDAIETEVAYGNPSPHQPQGAA
jgi:hypothetical protein